MDEPVCDRRSGIVVADDDRGRAALSRELGDQRVDHLGVLGVQLAGRLVGEQEPRAMCEGGAESDSLLLAAGQAPGPLVEPVSETHALQELRRRVAGFRPRAPHQLRAERDGLHAGQVRRERASIVLIEHA